MTRHRIPDERYVNGAVREWAATRPEPNYRDRDRTDVARVLHTQGMPNWEIAHILGIHWAQVDAVLAGKAVR